MSDRDASHTLTELQEARAEVDRLRDQLRWRKVLKEKPTQEGYHLVVFNRHIDLVYYWPSNDLWSISGWEYWRPIGPTPSQFPKKSVAMYQCKCGATKNTNEDCFNCGPLPGGE